MPTFSGAYIQEPRDFSTVTTEAALLQIADDPDLPVVPDNVFKWGDLTVEQAASLLSVITPIIERKEGIVDGYLRAGGYATPTDPVVNPLVVDWAVRLTWADLRLRKAQINTDEHKAITDEVLKELNAVANGTLALVGELTDAEPPSATVYAIGTAARIFSRDTLEDM